MMLVERARELRKYIVEAAQSLDDAKAVKCPELYDEWKPNNVEYTKDYKVRFNNKVYKVLTTHTSQTDWSPAVAASLFTIIDEVHMGTLEDPIPYSVNMEIFANKYYIQDDILYLCNRDSNIPLQHNLSELVGIYVEVI